MKKQAKVKAQEQIQNEIKEFVKRLERNYQLEIENISYSKKEKKILVLQKEE